MRLFVAVNLSTEVRRAIYGAADPFRNAGLPVKWVASDLLHLTVKFLGEVDADRIGAIEDAMRRAVRGVRSFELMLEGFGAFPSPRRPRVLWAGCDSAPQLELLHHGAEEAFREVGFAIEGKPFRPHVTIGRVRRDADQSAFKGLEGRLAAEALYAVTEVGSLDLMESVLQRDGPRYTKRFTAQLESQ